MKKLLLATALLCLQAGVVSAKDYPANPIRLIVPYSVGGPSDIIARIISQKAGEFIDGSIIVENKGGAGGTIGTHQAVNSAPDGYTAVMVSPGQIGIAVATRPDLPYDPKTDLIPVIELVEDTLVLAVSNNLPVSDVKSLITYLKAHPGKLNYSSASVGSITNMTMELFKKRFDVDVEHIPFKGSSESMMAIVSNDVSLGFASPSGMKSLLENKRLRAFAIASKRRSGMLPDVPTMSELGYKNLDSPLWYVLAVPKNTPSVIQQKLHDAFSRALKDSAVKKRLTDLGVEVVNGGPEQAGAVMNEDIKRWEGLVDSDKAPK